MANSVDRMATVERLEAVRVGDRGLWGVMHAAEMVCHVRGAFQMAMGELAADPVAVPMPRAVLKFAALWTPVPWRRNFATVPTLQRGMPAMQVGGFEADRAEAVGELRRFCQAEQVRVEHAFFGAMSVEDWMRWGYLHTDHHLRQFGR